MLDANAQATKNIERIDPPNWWIGFKNTKLQLLVYGNNIGQAELSLKHKGVKLLKLNRVENPNYLFVDLDISHSTKPGKMKLNFKVGEKSFSYDYALKTRAKNSAQRIGFNPSDVIYLVMPDRFSNGNPQNDNVKGMLEKADRTNGNGRHGGDIQGIINHLNYIKDMGFTAIWVNPVLENNMPKFSYHGYAITDYYNVDPRHGGNQTYLDFVKKSHEKGLKVIMDMVFNHCGTGNYLIKDMPMKSWVHQFDKFTRTNYRAMVTCDPYRSNYDEKLLEKGWFDTSMPDLNQDNPYVENYLTQNAIWWVEYAGLDGIRMDTHPYPEKHMMSRWCARMNNEYPNFNIVGEVWIHSEALSAYWQKNAPNKDGYNSNLKSLTDFPLFFAMQKAFTHKEGWKEGIASIYYTLAQDLVYPNPGNNVIFLDNHDIDRFYSAINYNQNIYKMALSFLLTTRGIPEIYYGTEILMDGFGSEGHFNIRKDFPGGWQGDKINAFTQKGLTKEQINAQIFTKKLLNWRKSNRAVQSGKLMQFIPDNGVYIMFRYTDDEAVMLILNNRYAQTAHTDKCAEILSKYTKGYDVVNEEELSSLEDIPMAAKSARIIVLKK